MHGSLNGEYNCILDIKGRVTVPIDLRRRLGTSFIITKGMDGCLFLYPIDEWEKFVDKLNKLPLTNSKTRAIKRSFLAGAVERIPDKQGRIIIPAELKDFASITDEVIFAGVGDHVEVWDKKVWKDTINMDDLFLYSEDLGFDL